VNSKKSWKQLSTQERPAPAKKKKKEEVCRPSRGVVLTVLVRLVRLVLPRRLLHNLSDEVTNEFWGGSTQKAVDKRCQLKRDPLHQRRKRRKRCQLKLLEWLLLKVGRPSRGAVLAVLVRLVRLRHIADRRLPRGGFEVEF